MNTKEINIELKKRLQIELSDVDALLQALANTLRDDLLDGNSISMQGFGTFEVKRNKERISINPLTKQRLLSPPKQSIAFKPSPILKEKFNS